MSDTNGNGYVTKQDLRELLGDMEERLHARFESFAAKADFESFATKADLERFATKADLERFATKEDVEAVETKLLTEFWKWGRVSDQKMRRVEFSDATTVERVSILEERVFTLERKALGSKE